MKRLTIKILIGTLFFSSLSYATVHLPYKLDQLAQQADIVFRGVCKEKRTESVVLSEGGRSVPVFNYVFDVQEWIKGNEGNTVDFKQLNIRSRREAFSYGVLGMVDDTRFEVGKEYVLFLTAPSQKFYGFRWVIGSGGEGSFQVSKDAKGETTVIAPRDVQGLPKKSVSAPATLKKVGKSESAAPLSSDKDVSYDEFKSLVKKVLKE